MVARFGGWLHHPNLWHLNRRSVPGAVAIGLFCGLIPGPLQMIGALLLAIPLRKNLPVALLLTLYTNPLTIVPLYVLAYGYGQFLLGATNGAMPIEPIFWDWSDIGAARCASSAPGRFRSASPWASGSLRSRALLPSPGTSRRTLAGGSTS